MTETKAEDILIPLLTKSNFYSDEETFNKKCKKIRTEEQKLYLEEKFGFSINFIHIITTQELKEIIEDLEVHEQFYKRREPSQNNLLIPSRFKSLNYPPFRQILNYLIALNYPLFRRILNYLKAPNKDNNFDSLDDLFLDDEADLYIDRKIFISKDPKSIELQNKKISYRLFINILEIKSENSNMLPYHIISVIPTSYNLKKIDGDELYNLSNEQIIELINYNFSEYFNDTNIKVHRIFKKGTFVAIQLWNQCWKGKQDNIFDAKSFVRKNPYYFYSILTLEKYVFRRTYENIMDVLGWCQSNSSVYFDVFHGTTCLELTTKPRIDHINGKYKDKFFDEIGHDSEQFRIWEFLALQHKLLIEINKKNLNKVDNLIEELDLVYNFNIFTKKNSKRERWIRYVKYLQRISGIDSDYQDYKSRIEIKNKEHESKLQKLNILIIVSIFASFLTLLLSPIYNSLVSTYNDPLLNSTINSTINPTNNYYYFTHIFKKTNPEIKAIHLALILTFTSYLYLNKTKIEKILKIEKDPIYVAIVLTIILVASFFLYE